jgi:hypothetical protein
VAPDAWLSPIRCLPSVCGCRSTLGVQ